MTWEAWQHEDGSWQVQQEDAPHWHRPEWVPGGGRAAKTIATHRNGGHAKRKPKTCPDCKEESQ